MNASHARFNLQELLKATGATGFNLEQQQAPRLSIVTDSRLATAETVFFPLCGERFDGHTFIEDLASQGTLCFCEHRYFEQNKTTLKTFPLLLVEDSLQSYQALATFHRRRSQATVIALTGSSGKTTVKEQLAWGLSAFKQVQATEKNFNNDIGATQTVLSLRDDTDCLIVEMGMRGLGEIERLSTMAEPDIALIVNAGVAHLERLGSREAIAQAKSELVLGTKHTVISNAQSPTLQEALQNRPEAMSRLRHVTYTLDDVDSLTVTPDGTYSFNYGGVTFQTTSPGLYQVSNLMAVIRVAEALELDLRVLAERMASFVAGLGRYEAHDLPGGNRVVDDAYNANPESMKASLQAFLDTPKRHSEERRVLILGSMKELGPASAAFHQELMAFVNTQPPGKVEAVIYVGKEFCELPLTLDAGTGVRLIHTVPSTGEAQPAITQVLNQLKTRTHLAWYLKGSRSHGLEALVPQLKKLLSPNL